MGTYDITLLFISLALLASLPAMLSRLGRPRRFAAALGLGVAAGGAQFALYFVASSLLWPQPTLGKDAMQVLAALSIAVATVILVAAIASRPSLRGIIGPAMGLATCIILAQATHAAGTPLAWSRHGIALLAGLAAAAILGWLAQRQRRSLRASMSIAAMIVTPLVLLACVDAAPGGAVDPLAMLVGCAGLCLVAAAAMLKQAKLEQAARRRRNRPVLPTLDLELSSQPMLLCRGDRVLRANAALASLLGRQKEELASLSLGVVMSRSDGTELGGGALPDEACLRARDGSSLPITIEERPFRCADRTVTCYALCDLRPARALESQIRVMSRRDAETGLANALGIREAIDRRIGECRATEDGFGVICMQLVGLGMVRRIHGREAYLAMIVRAAERVATQVAPDDVLAYLDGEQFALLHGGGDSVALADGVRQVFQAPVEAAGISAGIALAAGCAAYPADARDGASLLAAAEAAVTIASESASGVIAFDETGRAAIVNRRTLVCDLARAIERNELSLVYQPQVYIATGEPFGYEALLRWQHPTRGSVPPDIFIPLAEQAGLIGAIGEWVLERACAEATTWKRPLTISVNVSVLQLLASEFPARVRAILEATGLEAPRLELEITETAMAARGQRALEALRLLKPIGVRLSLDDFGAGFSSFGALRSFRFDRIKMDRSLVQNADRDRRLATLVRAIAVMTRSLGVSLVAEGIETIGECEFLRAERLVEGQGFLFGRPCAPPDFLEHVVVARRVMAAPPGGQRERRRVLV